MPDIITHYLFGKTAAKQMDEKIRRIIEKYPTPYAMGCCGPDYFFYYHAIPIKSQKEKDKIYELGELMHHHSINELFSCMLSYLKEQYSPYLHSYLLGFTMHYLADRNCHPYVYFHTGLGSVNKIYNYYHIQLEVAIDQWMLELLEGKTLKDFKPCEVNRHSKKDIDLLYPFIEHILNKVYDKHIDYQAFKECWDDYYQIKKIVGSTKMTMKQLVRYFERKTDQLPFLSSAIYAPDYKEYDVLNLKNKIWYDPCDTTLIYNTSFVECFYQGINETNQLVNAYTHYLEEGNDVYLQIIGNKGFDTNQIEGIEQKYFECIYEMEEK